MEAFLKCSSCSLLIKTPRGGGPSPQTKGKEQLPNKGIAKKKETTVLKGTYQGEQSTNTQESGCQWKNGRGSDGENGSLPRPGSKGLGGTVKLKLKLSRKSGRAKIKGKEGGDIAVPRSLRTFRGSKFLRITRNGCVKTREKAERGEGGARRGGTGEKREGGEAKRRHRPGGGQHPPP